MSKTVKGMMIRQYQERLAGVDNAVLISIRGVNNADSGAMRVKLRQDKIRVSVVQNGLAKVAFKGTGLETLEPLLTGPNAICYGAESVVEVARRIVGLLKDYPKLELRGAVLDGTLFEGKAGVEALSKYPTREEAIGQVVTLVLSPARKLAGAIVGPGRRLAGCIKDIELKLEKGEAIAKV